jgi:Lipocalin-like domain
MTTKLKIAPLAAALAAVLLVSAPPAFAQPSTRTDDARVERPQRGMGPLVGAWRMTSLEVGTDGNLQRVPYSGQIIFTRSGTMSVQAMNPDAEAPDTPYTLNGYEAFYGTVAVDRAARVTGRHRARGTFAVTVESSVVRDLIGQRLTRVFKVSRNKLVLTPTDPAEGWRVTYERF